MSRYILRSSGNAASESIELFRLKLGGFIVVWKVEQIGEEPMLMWYADNYQARCDSNRMR